MKLYKYVEKREHAEDLFINNKIRFSPISYYQKTGNKAILDERDGTLPINTNIKKIQYRKKDGNIIDFTPYFQTGYQKIGINRGFNLKKNFIACFSTEYSDDLKNKLGSFVLELELDFIKEEIPDYIKHRKVNYVDPSMKKAFLTQKEPKEDSLFTKSNEYKHEKEYRFLIDCQKLDVNRGNIVIEFNNLYNKLYE